MFKLKKGLKGFKVKQPPVRTKEEIDKDYSYHVGQAGHKAGIITELQQEIENHIARALVIKEEAKRLPPQTVPAPEEPKVEA